VCRGRLGEQCALSRHAGDERSREQQYGEQQVRERTRCDDRDAAPHRLAVERTRRVGGVDRPSRSSAIFT
jgi:hypothetical protein